MNKRLAIVILISIGAFASILWGSHSIFASPGGITQASGNPNDPLTCNTCHGGGIEPEVGLLGNPVVMPGELVSFTLKITGGQEIAGGFNVSTEGGTLTAPMGSMDVRAENDEVTHTGPKVVDGDGNVEFTFNWEAPMSPTVATLYGAGNSVNLADQTGGDLASFVVLDVTVGVYSNTVYLPLIISE